jgi:hypothetical protein
LSGATTSRVGHLEIDNDHLHRARFRGYLPVRQWLPARRRSCRKCAAAGVTTTIHAEGAQRAFEEVRLDGGSGNTAAGGLMDATPRERVTEYAGLTLMARAGRRRRRA